MPPRKTGDDRLGQPAIFILTGRGDADAPFVSGAITDYAVVVPNVREVPNCPHFSLRWRVNCEYIVPSQQSAGAGDGIVGLLELLKQLGPISSLHFVCFGLQQRRFCLTSTLIHHSDSLTQLFKKWE